jgi:hypothetical protein
LNQCSRNTDCQFLNSSQLWLWTCPMLARQSNKPRLRHTRRRWRGVSESGRGQSSSGVRVRGACPRPGCNIDQVAGS